MASTEVKTIDVIINIMMKRINLFVFILVYKYLSIISKMNIPIPYTNDIGPNKAPLCLFSFFILNTSDYKIKPKMLYIIIRFK